ncbi:MAG: hypothetical protein K2P84_06840 [Undibacterium sp.]|nr:hypothetical protein [Undibacterium sp.]
MPLRTLILLIASLGLMTACDRLGIPDPARDAAIKEADARATGSACRHAGRAIEDCYSLNPDAGRAAVYAGWKDMNDYMRENKIEEVKPSAIIANPATASSLSNGESEVATASSSASASASATGKASGH